MNDLLTIKEYKLMGVGGGHPFLFNSNNLFKAKLVCKQKFTSLTCIEP